MLKNEKLFKNAVAMRNFIDDAFNYKIEGYWSGSSHGYHPRGFLREGVLFVDEWNTHNYCSIYIAEDRTAKWLSAEKCPAVIGGVRATPYPEGCERISVWYTGRWVKQGPWCAVIDNIVTDVKREIELNRKKRELAEKKKAEEEQKAREKKEKELVEHWS